MQNKLFVTHKSGDKLILNNLLAESYLTDDPLKALHFASQARFLAESTGNSFEKAKAFYIMAVSNYMQGNYSLAYNLMVESQAGFHKVNDKLWYGKSCLELGKIHERQYAFERALESLVKAEEIFKELKDSSKLAETYNIFGISYSDQKDYEKAYDYFYNALKIRKQLNDEVGLSAIYNNIGEIYLQKNDWEAAREYFNMAININKRHNRLQSLAINYDNLGNIYISLENYDSALIYLEKSLLIAKNRSDQEMISISYISNGILNKKLRNTQKALQYFDSAYQISKSRGFLILMQQVAFELSEVYKETGQYKQAYHYHTTFKKAGDSLFNIENMGKIAQLEMKLIFDHENKMNQLRKEEVRYKYFTLAFGLLSILLVTILIIGRMKIKIKHSKITHDSLLLEGQQLKNEIEFKNRELATNVMYLVKKNELINFISEKLLKAKSNFKKERQEVVQEIILELQSNLDADIWKTFEERFKAVHHEFYEKLNENYPNLSENDKKLCALLRLNLSTKDIAAITHQNPNSIDVARTRLRKKLKISNKEITLISFLENL